MGVTSAPSSGPERARRRGTAFGERLIDLADDVSAEDLYDALFAAHPFSFWLDAGADAAEGLSYLGTGDELVVQGDPSAVRASGSPAIGRARILTVPDVGDHVRRRFAPRSEREYVRPSLGGFAPGWVGFLGYEWRAEGASTARAGARARPTRGGAAEGEPRDVAELRVPVTSDTDLQKKVGRAGGTRAGARNGAATGSAGRDTPEAAFLRVTRLLVVDHAARRVAVVWRGDNDGEGWADEVAGMIEERRRGGAVTSHVGPSDGADGAHGAEPGEPATTTGFRHPEPLWRHGRAAYRALVDRCRASIGRGDAYQLCLTNRIDVAGAFDPVEVFRTLRHSSPTQRGGLLRFGDLALVSASPEKFLGLDRSERIEVRPIKGTRPRASDAVRDGELADELRASAKERAENLMIVDLMRNDVGRVSAIGSVRVDALFDVESYAQVHQLVSTVSGQLADGVDAVDVLASTFPAGSMTGAPKQSAIDILGGLEGAPRGMYAGAFGLIGADGTLDLSMVIRSIVIDAFGASVGAGGGITWSSDAGDEVEEMVLKASAPLAALGASGRPPD